jgi:hypothetical protein
MAEDFRAVPLDYKLHFWDFDIPKKELRWFKCGLRTAMGPT